jgi:hypothetical protein
LSSRSGADIRGKWILIRTQELDRFLQKLSEMPDGDGTLLEHSLVPCGSGISNPKQHDRDPLPLLLAGGASGKLQGGRRIRAGRGTRMANRLAGMFEKLDIAADTFGDSNALLTI